MNPLFPELTRRYDPSKPVGYLNFSDGKPDVRFRTLLLEAFALLYGANDRAPWATLGQWLAASTKELAASGSAAFKNVSQAEAVIEQAFFALPSAYRAHHVDLLAHQPDEQLFTPLFLARCAECVLGVRAAGVASERIVEKALGQLNDYVGYRPIAVLETRPQTDFYPHERVCPIPLFFRDIGVGAGKYADLLRSAYELLSKTDPAVLYEACLDLNKLDEFALDPRAIDHFHPMTKRPNVLFGEWDPHKIDTRGFYRRFVLKQTTLDALVAWTVPNGQPNAERLFEASAVLAGTTLMGTGICGNGPTYHDSTVTLQTLVGKIARFRDQFYQRLLNNIPGAHGEKLREEAAKLKQPFGGVRQFLNGAIATERAFHLQERRLAILFAAMGYPTTALRRATAIPAPATRLSTEIRVRQTAAHFAIRVENIEVVPKLLLEAEDYLKRGINCGALIDPWNILGYQGLFPTFTDRGDAVRDPRAEELILCIGRQFEVYSQALAAASAESEPALADTLREGLSLLASWWDPFATTTVSDLPKVLGAERAEAAGHVAAALTLWKIGGANDPAFWRNHREGFTSPAAFSQVIEVLLEQSDYRASLALLVTWLSEADIVPLQDASASFYRLAFRWLRSVVIEDAPPLERTALVRRFFELLESNADARWLVPELFGGGSHDPLDDDEDDDEDDDFDDDDDERSEYASAYEGMTFRDSADDGEEGSIADGAGATQPNADFSLEGEEEGLLERLRFLAAVARFWRLAARPEIWPNTEPASLETIQDWLQAARENVSELVQFTQDIYEITIPEPIGGTEGASEFDRRRIVKGNILEAAVQTIVETIAAARSLGAVLPKKPTPIGSQGPTADVSTWEPIAVRLERAVATGNRGSARKLLPGFLSSFRHEPLLVCPPADGGEPVQALRAQTAQQVMESMLARMPRLGLLRETFHLTKLARAMERNEMPEGRRISSFDVLFRTAVTSSVDAILTSARDWGEDANEDGPLAADLKQVADAYHKLWVEHSQTLRLSTLEVALDRNEWDDVVEFISTYGSDLFTVRFLTLGNLRGVMAQGAADWLDREVAQPAAPDRFKLVDAWEEGIPDKSKTARLFEVVLNTLVEHYDEYRDYNTTTTQSDYGENIHILLDFLRLKVAYDRYAWRLKPMVLAHEVLCRRGYDRLAMKWREYVSTRMEPTANELLTELTKREIEHGIKLRTIRDRLEERFVQPLQVDQAAARVARAASAAREGQSEENPSFTGLLAAIKPLADTPVGVGLDVPAWVRRLEDEMRKVRFAHPDHDDDNDVDDDMGIATGGEDFPLPPSPKLDMAEFREQLRRWDEPIA